MADNNIIITSESGVEGFVIKEYLGMYSGECVFNVSNISDFTVTVKDISSRASRVFSERIKAAKKVAVESLLSECSARGANAIIGVKFDYLRVSDHIIGVVVDGTAVVITKPESSVTEKSRKSIRIYGSNIVDDFIPLFFVLSEEEKQKIAIEILPKDDCTISGIITDIEIKTIFGDIWAKENQALTGFKDSVLKHKRSNCSRIEMPWHVFECIDTCVIRVKKYICNGEIKTVENMSIIDVIQYMKEKKNTDTKISVKDLLNELSGMSTPIQMLEYLEKQKSNCQEEVYEKLHTLLASQKQETTQGDDPEEILSNIKMEFREELFADIPMRPIIVDEHNKKCPCCGLLQDRKRSICFKCGTRFCV